MTDKMKRAAALLAAIAMTTVLGCSKAQEDVPDVKVGRQIGDVKQTLRTLNDERVSSIDAATEATGQDPQRAQ